MSRIYIFNILSDCIKTDGRDEITRLGLHELICDRQIESSTKIERRVVAILDSVEYKSVIKKGYYTVDD